MKFKVDFMIYNRLFTTQNINLDCAMSDHDVQNMEVRFWPKVGQIYVEWDKL